MAVCGISLEDKFKDGTSFVVTGTDVTLEAHSDFRDLKKILKDVRPDHPLGDPFVPCTASTNPDDACWIVGRDASGAVVYLHALRVLPTYDPKKANGLSVADYFAKAYREFSPSELDIDFDRSTYRACPDAHRMRGRVIYSGEVWIGGKPGQYRGTGLIGRLMRHAMELAISRLNADYFLGFVAMPQAIKGLTMRFGYMHVDPFALRWYVKGKQDPLEGAMVYMGKEDIEYILGLPKTELEEVEARAAA